ncbi:ABC transporter permease subunit [Clostridium cadaveris]|uniref:ABC transporter permease n=1 Tax=Clostridium cadaveris TaxID=1529 RepID=UPI001459A290|nr:ABC transporter permease [Clostridium cadaveris]NME64858.1 ABC transporter permease subunit [Clostridium cadaveris]
MLNLVKADLYRFIHRPFGYLAAGIIGFLTILVQFFLSIGNDPASKEYVLINVIPKGIEIILILIFIFSVFIEDEYKEGTLKNVICSNISRGKIYLSKCISEIILALIVCAVVFISFLIGFSLLKWENGYDNTLFYEFLKRLIAIIPVFLGALAMSNALRVIIKNNTSAIFAYTIFILSSKKVIIFLASTIWSKFSKLNDYLLYTQIEIFNDYTLGNKALINVAIVGIATAIIFNFIGYLVFRNSEVK